jgi:hypothetical protein
MGVAIRRQKREGEGDVDFELFSIFMYMYVYHPRFTEKWKYALYTGPESTI